MLTIGNGLGIGRWIKKSAFGLSWGLLAISLSTVSGQDLLAHRKSNLSITVTDSAGNAITNATLDVKMSNHAFRFGTQIHDQLFTISQTAFESRTDQQKRGLIGNFSGAGYVPTWQDTLNYRTAVSENFNHVTPTNGMQWTQYNSVGPAPVDAAILQAQSQGMSVTGHAVVWQNDGWPTPTEFRPAANPNAQTFHNTLIEQRLSSTGIMARYSDSGVGPTVIDWDVVNEPLNETYYADTFVSAGIYSSRNRAVADYFIRADAIRPDALLAINEFNILNSNSDTNAIRYRDLINDLRVLGAPIDQIKVQAHMGQVVSKADITRRLDILASTGLPVSISEFDMRDDANQISTADQAILFRNMLEASFEHQSVNAFIMWGFWDPAHWRSNGPLFDQAWNVKTEAAPWFDLVRGDWMTELDGQLLGSNGIWSNSVFKGTYDFTVNLNGQAYSFEDRSVLDNSSFTLIVAVPEPSSLCLVGLGSIVAVGCRRRKR